MLKRRACTSFKAGPVQPAELAKFQGLSFYLRTLPKKLGKFEIR